MTVRLRYSYRVEDGSTLGGDDPLPVRTLGGRTYRLSGLGLELSRTVGQGPLATTRRLGGDISLKAAELDIRGQDCTPPSEPPVGGESGGWRSSGPTPGSRRT